MKNSELVFFLNNMDALRKMKLPTKILFAISYNEKTLKIAAETYEEQRKKIREMYTGEESYLAEVNKLLSLGFEAGVQKITRADLEECDASKYDALTLEYLSILEFMIEKDAPEKDTPG